VVGEVVGGYLTESDRDGVLACLQIGVRNRQAVIRKQTVDAFANGGVALEIAVDGGVTGAAGDEVAVDGDNDGGLVVRGKPDVERTIARGCGRQVEGDG
jgi:hypothetical protein